LRGADLVAEALSKSTSGPVAVIVPDWFDGTVADKSWVPPVSDEQKQKLGNFIQTKASPELVVPRVIKFAQALQHHTILSQVQKLGLFGFCWGGKLASIACQQSANNIFTVAVQTSPARVDPEEAKNILVPMALLTSEDEDQETLIKFYENLPTQDKLLERFDNQIHGWMSGR
jgi:dienelactone hydrolase